MPLFQIDTIRMRYLPIFLLFDIDIDIMTPLLKDRVLGNLAKEVITRCLDNEIMNKQVKKLNKLGQNEKNLA